MTSFLAIIAIFLSFSSSHTHPHTRGKNIRRPFCGKGSFRTHTSKTDHKVDKHFKWHYHYNNSPWKTVTKDLYSKYIFSKILSKLKKTMGRRFAWTLERTCSTSLEITSTDGDVIQLECSDIAGGNVKWHYHFAKWLLLSCKVKYMLAICSIIFTSKYVVTSPRERKHVFRNKLVHQRS